MMNSGVEPLSRVGVALDLILKTLIASSDFASHQSKNWEAISRLIPGTTAIQCARRYEELLTGGGGVALQHFSRSISSQGGFGGSVSAGEGDGSTRLQANHSRPNSSRTKGNKEDKDKSQGGKEGSFKRDMGQKSPIMVIHVCDEAKNLKKDFQCPRDLLVQEMKYFAEYLSTDAQRWEEVDISVHCDVQIFDWLIKYVKRTTKEVVEEPRLEANNVVSILISSDFLKMDSLVMECIKFCHKNMSTIVATPCNMGCINDRLLTRIADLFSHNEADEVKDRKDKFKSKLFAKKIEKLFEPEGLNPDSPEKATTFFRCSVCKRHLTQTLQGKVKCMPSRMTIDRCGKMTYSHVSDPTFDLNDYILELKSQLKTWRDVYWRLWGTVNYLNCARCGDVFTLSEFGHCSYHPESVRYEGEPGSGAAVVGVYPCCHQKALRFDPTLITKGCRVKDHIVSDTSGDGDTGKQQGKSPQQRVCEDMLSRRDVICVPYQRLSDASESEMTINVFANEMFACHEHRAALHLPPVCMAGVEEKKLEGTKPRLQALTVEKEVSYYIDDPEFGGSDDEVGDDEQGNTGKRQNRGRKKSRVTVEPQAILVDAPEFEQTKKSTWDTQRSMRYNQDAQRQEDARRMKEIRLFLTRLRLTAEKVERPKREFAGGLYSKLESQWKAVNMPSQSRQSLMGFRARPKPFGMTRSSIS